MGNMCVVSCPPEHFENSEENRCVEQCSQVNEYQPTSGNLCQTSCPNEFINTDDDACVNSCPPNEFVSQGIRCVSNCSDTMEILSADMRNCISMCAPGNYQTLDG